MMRKFVLGLSGIAAMLIIAATGSLAADYAHELTDKAMSVAWSVNGDTLAVKMSAPTEGWVGVGFNPSDQMKDANFILGYVKKGKAKIKDEFGIEKAKHSSDKKLGGTTDVTLVSGVEEAGVTTIEFTMPLNSADKNDSKIDVNGETTLLLAFGAGRDSFRSKHKHRSAFKVNLTSGAAEKVK